MEERENPLTNPKILKHYSLLQELEILPYIEFLKRDIINYENILKSAKEVLTHTNLDDILESTVNQISERILPSFLIFLWRPLQGKEDLTIKAYRNLRITEIPLGLSSLSPFENFFLKYPQPISYGLFEYKLSAPEITKPLDLIKPDIIVPVIGRSGLYGLILIGPKVLENQYTPQELAFLDKIMTFCSLAIQNHLHYEHSVRDGKTGLFNHGYFMNRINDEASRVQRTGHPFSVIILDVDKFKTFNDRFGHLAGDKVLEQIASAIKNNLRVPDIPSRFGGEEFMILLPETNRASAWIVAERLRETIAQIHVPWEVPLPKVTVSAGIAVYDRSTRVPIEELLKRADAALYQSKERGRNRTSVWGAGLLFRTERAKIS